MKMVKNIAIVACAASFMFASVSFNMSNVYSDLDSGAATTTSYGAAYDLNESTSLGYDSSLGMLFMFDVPAGVTLRLGWDGDADDNGVANDPTTAVGLGFTWWTGGTGLKTSISTAYDMVSVSGGDSEGKLSVTVGFGF
tara:strand:+ start:6597 stop:7013 length:417 start_codon:yes stop_codon:yes gene_type:complete